MQEFVFRCSSLNLVELRNFSKQLLRANNIRSHVDIFKDYVHVELLDDVDLHKFFQLIQIVSVQASFVKSDFVVTSIIYGFNA